MKVKQTTRGWLIDVAFGQVGILLVYLSGRAFWSYGPPVVSWPMFGVLTVAALVVLLRLERIGVFDTRDGGVLVKRIFVNTRIAASAEPGVAFDKALVGHRLVIKTNKGRRVRTGFWFRKPALPKDLEPPANLRVPAAAEAHSG